MSFCNVGNYWYLFKKHYTMEQLVTVLNWFLFINAQGYLMFLIISLLENTHIASFRPLRLPNPSSCPPIVAILVHSHFHPVPFQSATVWSLKWGLKHIVWKQKLMLLSLITSLIYPYFPLFYGYLNST